MTIDERKLAVRWEGWDDEALNRRWEVLCRKHDRLIDSADMGDERIYFAGKEMDSIRAEQRRRAALPQPPLSEPRGES